MTTTQQDGRLALRLLKTLAPLKGRMAVSILLRLVSQGTGILLLAWGAWVVGQVLVRGTWEPLPTVGLLLGLGLLKAVSRYGEQVAGHSVAFETLAVLREKAYATLARLAPGLRGLPSSGELLARLVPDIDRIEVFYAHTVGPVSAALVLGTAITVTAGMISGPAAAVLGCGYFAVAFGIPLASYLRTRQVGASVRSEKGLLSSQVAAAFRGAEDLFWARGDQQILQKIDSQTDRILSSQRAAAWVAGAKDGFGDLVIGLTLVGLVFCSFGLSVDVRCLLVALGAGAFGSALAVGRAFDDLPETAASARRLFEIFDREPEVRYPDRGALWSGRPLGLRLDKVTFGYHEIPVVENQSFELVAGSRVVLLGPSGRGKSTLVKLIAREFDPWSGQIILGGRPLAEWPEAELRRAIVVLNQDTFVLDSTVGENITTFRPDVSLTNIETSLEALGLWRDGAGRLDRATGPRGRFLSGGERKRLVLARALAERPGLLILDEAFSNLDASARALVRSLVLESAKGITVVEVSHEPHDADGADLVLELRATIPV